MNVTARKVFAARGRWLKKPCLRTRQAYMALREAYDRRFPGRRLDLFNRRVELTGGADGKPA